MSWSKIMILTAVMAMLVFACCKPDEDEDDGGGGEYTQTPYELDIPSGFPAPNIPADNPLTVEGVELGRRIFYDPILSADGSMACASCHKQEFGFGTNTPVDAGIHGIEGTRNSMPLFNLVFWDRFTWDGRAGSLEEQAIEPVINPIELADTWENIEEKLNIDTIYQRMFKEAFNAEEITQELTTKAIAQFLRSIISVDYRFRLASVAGSSVFLSDGELEGYDLYKQHLVSSCLHCHSLDGMIFTDFVFRNNGLDEVSNPEDFADLGLGGVTGNTSDNGLFKTPTLLNLAFTAPYMHDGRFETLDEVLEFYNEHVKESPTLDIIAETDFIENGGGNFLEEYELQALKEFLLSLTDSTLVTNPAYANPFD